MNKQKIVIPSGIGLSADLRVGQLSWLVKMWLWHFASFFCL